MKPRIYHSQGYYWCTDGGPSYGRGSTAEAAYWSWAWLEERLGRNRHRG
jgi:hypothetical protein